MSRPTNNNRSLVLYRSQVAGPMPARRPRMFRKRKRAPYLAPLTRVSRMPTYRNSIGPPETDVTLVYTETSTISAAATFQSKVWNVNAPFQPDPSTGGSVPGFNEWAGLYKFCRTIKVWCKADLCNLQAFPCVGYMYLGNASPGTGMPFSIVGNALTCYAQMSAVGGLDRCTLSLTATICDIVGSNAPETDDNIVLWSLQFLLIFHGLLLAYSPTPVLTLLLVVPTLWLFACLHGFMTVLNLPLRFLFRSSNGANCILNWKIQPVRCTLHYSGC